MPHLRRSVRNGIRRYKYFALTVLLSGSLKEIVTRAPLTPALSPSDGEREKYRERLVAPEINCLNHFN
jgi:hypothetical protein